MQRVAPDDLAGPAYWEERWSSSELPAPVDPRDSSRRNYQNRRLDAKFRRALDGLATNGGEALEIGCARSAWLPYFACEFGMSVFGLDYSETGCDQARQVLASAQVEGTITCADLFVPPKGWSNRFDALLTIGLVDHFSDAAKCTAALADYLRPNGVIITLIPNLTGLIGTLLRAMNPKVHGIHVRLDPQQLAAAHEAAGLRVIESAFFMGANFGVLNLVGLDPAALSTRVKAAVLRSLDRLSQLAWLIETRTRPLPASRFFSPYILCIARKAPGPDGLPG
jgi:2-polyprenyl-3-methyl-5-hydroxy-6-metoxy-1,4-benzoquinol methylase